MWCEKKKNVLFCLRLRCELFSVKDPTGNLFTSTAGLLLCGSPLSGKPYILVAYYQRLLELWG